MSDTSQGPGWWLATDGKWYAPEPRPTPLPPPPDRGPSVPGQYQIPPNSPNKSGNKTVLFIVFGSLGVVVVAVVVVVLALHGIGSKHLPTTWTSNTGDNVASGSCTANADGTQITASGTFSSPVQAGATNGGIPLTDVMVLTVTDKNGNEMATGFVNVANGSTAWSVSATSQEPGVSPTGCVLNFHTTLQ